MKPSRRPSSPLRAAAVACAACIALAAQAAPHKPSDCDDPATAKAIKVEVDARMKALNAHQAETQKRLDGELKQRGAERHWSNERVQQLMMDILMSKDVEAFEKQKQPYMQQLIEVMQQSMASKGPEDVKATCRQVLKIDAMLDDVQRINDREFAYMSGAIRAAK